MSKHEIGPVQPWWRFKILWLALGGPAVVVVASFITLAIALRAGDRPIHANDASEANNASATVPALQARNHAVAAKR